MMLFRTVLLAAAVCVEINQCVGRATWAKGILHRLVALWLPAAWPDQAGGRQSSQIRSEYLGGHATTAAVNPGLKGRRMRYERY